MFFRYFISYMLVAHVALGAAGSPENRANGRRYDPTGTLEKSRYGPFTGVSLECNSGDGSCAAQAQLECILNIAPELPVGRCAT